MTSIPKRYGDRELLLAEHRGILKRVADNLGVSISLVSRVYHGKVRRSPRVQAEIERQIQEAVNAA